MSSDLGRAAIYSAESLLGTMFDRADTSPGRQVELFGSTITLPIERKFASIASVQDYADRVLGLNWVVAQWPRATGPVTVRPRRGDRAAHYEAPGVIAVPPPTIGSAWAMRELVVLHELAHHLTWDPAFAPHGAEFFDCMLHLIGEIIGAEAGFVLQALHSTGS